MIEDALELTLMLLAIFPAANIRAAREGLTNAGHPVPTLPVRTPLQIVFFTATITVSVASK
ncbi:MAG: hypothetical protein WAN03_00475 [Candidatus Sulfotelmatobacter sp.]